MTEDMDTNVEFSMFSPFEIIDYEEESFTGVLFGLEAQENEFFSCIAALPHREDYISLGLIPPGTVLLIGEPGTGKTTLVHKVASTVKAMVVKLLYDEILAEDLKETDNLLEEAFNMFEQIIHENPDKTIILLLDNLDSLDHGQIPMVPDFLTQVQLSLASHIRRVHNTFHNVLIVGIVSDETVLPIRLHECFRNKLIVPVTSVEVAALYLEAFLERVNKTQAIKINFIPNLLLDEIEGVPIGYLRTLLSIALDSAWKKDPPELTTQHVLNVFKPYLKYYWEQKQAKQSSLTLPSATAPNHGNQYLSSHNFPNDLAGQLLLLKKRAEHDESVSSQPKALFNETEAETLASSSTPQTPIEPTEDLTESDGGGEI